MTSATDTAWRSNPEVARLASPPPSLGRRIEETVLPVELPLRAVSTADDFRLRPDPAGTPAGVGDLFAQAPRTSPWSARLAIAVTLAIVVAASGWALATGTSRVAGPPDRVSAADARPRPLELLSLQHVQAPEQLTVTGVVENPRDGAPLTHVVATAVAFGPDGSLLARGRAPLDSTSLGAGDQSPFAVTIPVTGTVARYRVGFRAADGGVIGHVDRRRKD